MRKLARLFLVNLFVNVSGLGLVALGLYVLAG